MKRCNFAVQNVLYTLIHIIVAYVFVCYGISTGEEQHPCQS